MKISGITSGYIFPKNNILSERKLGNLIGKSKLPCTYGAYSNNLRTVIMVKLKLRSEDIFTVSTHILRKTGYLMAVWGVLYGNNKNAYKDIVSAPGKFFILIFFISYLLLNINYLILFVP